MFLYVRLCIHTHLTLRNRNWPKTRFFGGCHGKKRERPRSPPAESGGASTVRHVQETVCREVDLSSRYLEDGLKPGLNRASRSLRRYGQHICTCIYNNSMQQQRQSNDKQTANGRHTGFIHIVTAAPTPYNSYVRVNSTKKGNGTLKQRPHRQCDKQQAVSNVICIPNNMFTLGRYPVRIDKKRHIKTTTKRR